MDVSTKNILRTPLEVFQWFQVSFPLVKADIEVVKDVPHMRLNLTDQYVIEITKALDTKPLEKVIRQIFFTIQRNANTERIERDFSPEIYSLPLSDWKTFRRVMYEREGNRCSLLIVSYLKTHSSELLSVLVHLGLSPDHVKADCSEKDYRYFKEVFSLIEDSKDLLQIFETEYPKVFMIWLEELATNDIAQGSNGGDTYRSVLTSLRENVIGQNQATEKMALVLSSQFNQSSNKVFLFVGPTGVGKTELAKAASKLKGDRFIMFAMNQFQNEMDVNRFFGSGPGLVGSTDKPHLAKELDQCNPILLRQEGDKKVYAVKNAVVLFDEFEKAHSRVKQSLLTLFDEGFCELQYTKNDRNIQIRYKLSTCMIICTANLYQIEILEGFVQGLTVDQITERFVECNRVIRLPESFSPELLGRMNIVPFGSIPRRDFQSMIDLKLKYFLRTLKDELSCREIVVEEKSQVLAHLENRLYGNGTDIRRLKKYFDDHIKGVIYQQRHKWGNLENKKITITYSPVHDLHLLVSVYIEKLNRYVEPQKLLPIPF